MVILDVLADGKHHLSGITQKRHAMLSCVVMEKRTIRKSYSINFGTLNISWEIVSCPTSSSSIIIQLFSQHTWFAPAPYPFNPR